MQKLWMTLGLALGLCLSGVAAASQDAASQFSASGFLPNYTHLKPVEGRDGVWRYMDRSFDIKPYRKIYLDPVEVVLNMQGADYKATQPDVMKRFTDTFHAAFVEALSASYVIVPAPSRDALRVRLAITGIQPARPTLGVSDFIPVKALINLGRAATGNSKKVAEMSAEMEILDGNNRQVAAIIATRKAQATLSQADRITWDDLAPIAQTWASQLQQGLDAARQARKVD